MSYYNTCPNCGATLDPGERCDCTNEEKILRDTLHQMVDGIRDRGKLKRLYHLAEYLYIREDN